NRYYDPKLGRFISEDPAKSGSNWYVYCENNPLKFVDPWGAGCGRTFCYT
ncbi:RHS repeat-associated core domain-containing protein, partial [Congzhengia minquanensis]